MRLPYAPKKRRQPLVPEPVEGQAKHKLSLNQPPQPADDVPSPIPIQTMREWGLDCNVSPAELTDSVLLAGRAKMVTHEDEDPDE